MSPDRSFALSPDLAIVSVAIYLAIGVFAGLALARSESSRRGRWVTLGLSTFVWPLWVPIASFGGPDRETHAETDLEQRIHVSLHEAQEAVRGTPLESLLPESNVTAIRASVRRAAIRVRDLSATVDRNERGAEETRARIAAMELGGNGGRSLTTARVHLENLRKLSRLRDDEYAALLDLADLCDALRSQLVLARFAGSSVDGIGDLVSELDARVEGLDSALEAVVSDVRLA